MSKLSDGEADDKPRDKRPGLPAPGTMTVARCTRNPTRVYLARNLETGETGVILTSPIPRSPRRA